ncbi:MAG: M20/M25/M40 family metallo-hydrolase [Chloroflexi bacterium]|nr:M20/M25/M40 family metallo-hydrolase [Chloroflexota bacterium]
MKDSYAAVHKYIDTHFDEHLAETQRYLRQPSVSLTNEGVLECAEMTRELIAQLGAERAEVVHFDRGFPVVYGFLRSKRPNARTIAAYSLYDVMPIDPHENWAVPPFSAEIVEPGRIDLPEDYGPCIVARGARNQKGPIMAFINALKSMLAVQGDIPCNVMFTFDGEEEMGSTNFVGPFRERFMDELRQIDAAFYLNPSQNEKREVIIYLGCRGISFMELRLRGGDWGGPVRAATFAADMLWIDSPAWRLLKAVSTLMDPDGRVLVEGFYDNIRPWSDDDRSLIKILQDQFDERTMMQRMDIRSWKGGKRGVDLLPEYVMSPLMNVDGYDAGYTGPRVKTMFPHEAVIKLDIRIVPDQDIDDIMARVRKHLDDHGFPEVEIEVFGKYNGTKTDDHSDVAQAAIRASEQFGVPTLAWPIYYAGVPQWVFNGPPLHKPVISGGMGRMGREHVQNEYMTVEGLRDYEKWVVNFLHEFADA